MIGRAPSSVSFLSMSHTGAANEIDIIAATTVAYYYSSEDPAHLIEHAFDGCSGPDATRWISARDNTVEHIVIEFDRPQIISRLSYQVEERVLERIQEVRGEISDDAGHSYRQISTQDYTFSPQGATYQQEEQRFDRIHAEHLRLTVVPNKNGSGRATLTTLRLFS